MSDTEIHADPLLTVDEVAARMNVKPRFVRRLIHERRIEVRHLGKFVRIRASVVEDFIDAGTVPAVRRPGPRRRVALWPVAAASAVSAVFPRAAGRLAFPARTALTVPRLTHSPPRQTPLPG